MDSHLITHNILSSFHFGLSSSIIFTALIRSLSARSIWLIIKALSREAALLIFSPLPLCKKNTAETSFLCPWVTSPWLSRHLLILTNTASFSGLSSVDSEPQFPILQPEHRSAVEGIGLYFFTLLPFGLFFVFPHSRCCFWLLQGWGRQDGKGRGRKVTCDLCCLIWSRWRCAAGGWMLAMSLIASDKNDALWLAICESPLVLVTNSTSPLLLGLPPWMQSFWGRSPFRHSSPATFWVFHLGLGKLRCLPNSRSPAHWQQKSFLSLLPPGPYSL